MRRVLLVVMRGCQLAVPSWHAPRRRLAAVGLAVAILALSACVSAPSVRPTLPAADTSAAEAAQAAREARLRRAAAWHLTGRIAVSNGRDGGSGRIEWTQSTRNFEISLSAPVTRQSWRLTGNGSGARLEGIEGGPREGADARELLQQATGWDIPVVALADWVRGLRSPALPAADLRFGDDGLPARLEQGGWSIDYEWPRPATPDALPLKLDARNGTARVKLVVDAWE